MGWSKEPLTRSELQSDTCGQSRLPDREPPIYEEIDTEDAQCRANRNLKMVAIRADTLHATLTP